MKFDISPSGMNETGQKATRHGNDLDSDVRTLLDALDGAGSASGGPIAEALARFAGDVQQKTGIMSSRVACTVDGAGRATSIFGEGDDEMRSNANQGMGGVNSSENGWLGQGGR
ncbi:DUF6507 family protein [Streptomyces sp. NPDC000151]|uniref:DUF6507 family protein n=1 Tax=Streptomyces sp. NPDC000151 TaxID=3154244 RepID=UPI0033288C29